MEEFLRPKIDIPLTKADKAIEIFGLVLLLVFWGFTFWNYGKLPEIIPTHFNMAGEVDGHGNKWMIITLPLVVTLLYLGLSWISKYPHKFNYAVTITEANAEKQYSIVTKMFRVLKIVISIVFFLIAHETVQTALGLPNVLGKWFLLIVFSLIFVPIFWFLILSAKNS